MGLPADHALEVFAPLRGELIAAATATLRRHARDWTDYVSLCEALGLEADE